MTFQENNVKESTTDIKNIRTRYEKFEKAVFEKKIQETAFVVKDTNKLLDRINETTARINQDLEKVKTEIDGIAPQTKEQKHKLNQIQDILADAEFNMEKA